MFPPVGDGTGPMIGHTKQSRKIKATITPGTIYVASYFAPNGHYSVTPAGLNAAVTNGPLTAVANATSANGVYAYSASSTFPTSTYNANSYSVDVLFAPTPTG